MEKKKTFFWGICLNSRKGINGLEMEVDRPVKMGLLAITDTGPK